jgi:hypothetical protein
LEQVNLNNLDSDSIPEYKPTRERKFWYPPNPGFKPAKAHGELEWMTAADKADGRDEGSVDNIFCAKGPRSLRSLRSLRGATGLTRSRFRSTGC